MFSHRPLRSLGMLTCGLHLAIFSSVLVYGQEKNDVESGRIRRSTGRMSLPVFRVNEPESRLANGANPSSAVRTEGLASSRQIARQTSENKNTLPAATSVSFRPAIVAHGYAVGAVAQENQEVLDDTLQSKQQRDLLRPISNIVLNVKIDDQQIPRDRSYDILQRDHGDWFTVVGNQPLSYQWDAPNIRYRKLYFEDVAVERYGQACNGIQGTYRATAHWGASLLTVPLKMRLDPYYDCDTPYGFCRPGDATPSIWQRHVYR